MDKRISKIIKEWKDEAGIKSIVLVSQFSTISKKIVICTNMPGYMIGYQGTLVEKYKSKLKEINHKLETIEFVETDSWFIR